MQHYGMAASPPGALPRGHGERIVEGLLLGEASRMGSPPPSKVITVDTPFGPPSVATTMTASPFCKSASAAAGMRLIICCRSAVPPPPGLSIPLNRPELPLPGGGPLGFIAGLALTAGAPAPRAGADRCGSGGRALRRTAIPLAPRPGNFRNRASAAVLTLAGLFATSCPTVMVA